MTRVPELDLAALSPEQKRVRDEIAGMVAMTLVAFDVPARGGKRLP